MSLFEKALFDKLRGRASLDPRAYRQAIIERDGVIHSVIAQDRKLVAWTDAGPLAVTHVDIDIDADVDVEASLVRRLALAGKASLVAVQSVLEGQAGLLFVDGVFLRKLEAAVYGVWNIGRTV